jgi:hypothetical protein
LEDGGRRPGLERLGDDGAFANTQLKLDEGKLAECHTIEREN